MLREGEHKRRWLSEGKPSGPSWYGLALTECAPWVMKAFFISWESSSNLVVRGSHGEWRRKVKCSLSSRDRSDSLQADSQSLVRQDWKLCSLISCCSRKEDNNEYFWVLICTYLFKAVSEYFTCTSSLILVMTREVSVMIPIVQTRKLGPKKVKYPRLHCKLMANLEFKLDGQLLSAHC